MINAIYLAKLVVMLPAQDVFLAPKMTIEMIVILLSINNVHALKGSMIMEQTASAQFVTFHVRLAMEQVIHLVYLAQTTPNITLTQIIN